MSLRARLLASVLLVIGLVLAALTVGYNVVLANRVNADASGVVQARASAELAALNLAGGRITLGEAPDQSSPDTQIWVFQGGVALEKPQSAPAADDAAAAAMAQARSGTRDIPGTRTRLYSVPVVSAGGRAGTVVAGVSLAPYDQTRHTALVASVVLALVALIAVGIAGWWLISRALRPVAKMTAHAAEWSDRDLDRRFSLGEPHDELTQLASTLDRLLDRLAASLRHEQRLSAELSHELRTPLANIAAQAQFALRHSEQGEDGRQALAQILESAVQMGRTLDTLIAAARGELNLARATSDAVAGASAAAAAAVPQATEHSVAATVHAPPEAVRVSAEQALVERVLAPLIENAHRHANRTVTITVDRNGASARFTVEDDGPGVSDSEREAIFEPGQRGTGSQTTTLALKGAGLGLALSRRLARTAGGDVAAEASDSGARFVVTLPAADPPAVA